MEDPREEHINAVTWLNELSSISFYLIKLEAVRIENSPPAPLFTKIVGPSEELKQIGQTKKDLNEGEARRLEFIERLLEYAQSKTSLHANIKASSKGWVTTSLDIQV